VLIFGNYVRESSTKKNGDGDFKKLGKAIGLLAEAPVFIDDSATLTIAEIRAKARRLQFEHKIELLIVDYLQLMEGIGLKREGSRGLRNFSWTKSSCSRFEYSGFGSFPTFSCS